MRTSYHVSGINTSVPNTNLKFFSLDEEIIKLIIFLEYAIEINLFYIVPAGIMKIAVLF